MNWERVVCYLSAVAPLTHLQAQASPPRALSLLVQQVPSCPTLTARPPLWCPGSKKHPCSQCSALVTGFFLFKCLILFQKDLTAIETQGRTTRIGRVRRGGHRRTFPSLFSTCVFTQGGGDETRSQCLATEARRHIATSVPAGRWPPASPSSPRLSSEAQGLS